MEHIMIYFMILLKTIECSNSKLMVRHVDYRSSTYFRTNLTFKNMDDGVFLLDMALSFDKTMLKQIVNFLDMILIQL